MKWLSIFTLILTINFTNSANAFRAFGFIGNICPDGYILIKQTQLEVPRDFCVAQFEMKHPFVSSGMPAVGEENERPQSKPEFQPWVNITRDQAIARCQSLGPQFDLISRNQWQEIALNSVYRGLNWSGGLGGAGLMNQGIISGVVGQSVTNPSDPCSDTGTSCDFVSWHSQRRTLFLDQTSVIWDLNGNVSEWTRSEHLGLAIVNTPISQISGADRSSFGTFQSCSGANFSPWCGYGYFSVSGLINYPVVRGGSFQDGAQGGLLSAKMQFSNSSSSIGIGFRCVFNP